MNKLFNESVDEEKFDWTNWWVVEWLSESVSEWVSQWVRQWVSQLVDGTLRTTWLEIMYLSRFTILPRRWLRQELFYGLYFMR